MRPYMERLIRNELFILMTVALSVNAATVVVLYFFFQAEDGIRALTVTGVQTCALPICRRARRCPRRGRRPRRTAAACCGRTAERRVAEQSRSPSGARHQKQKTGKT